MSKCNKIKKQESDGQASLFGDDTQEEETSFTLEEVDDFSQEEKLSFEKELLGFYLTSHPHMDTLSLIKAFVTHEIDLLEGENEGTTVKVGGIIEYYKKIFTKKSNAEMAFISISNEKGLSVECVVFPKVFEQYKSLLIQDSVIVLQGRLDSKDDKHVIIVDTIYPAKNFTVKN